MGTGPFDFDGYDPTSPEDQTEPYKHPNADPLNQFGILSDTQKAQMAFSMQRALMQQQLQNQSRMLGMQQIQQNLGLGAAQSATGFGFPALMAMGGGNPQNNQLSAALNKIIGSAAGKRAGIERGPFGSLSGGGGSDASKILAEELQNSPDTPTAYKNASSRIAQLGQRTGDTNLLDVATRMRIQANQLDQGQQKNQSEVAKNQSEAAKNQFDVTKGKAELGNPGPTFDIHYPNGDLGRAYATHDSQGKFTGYQETPFRGPPIQYTLDSTPGGREKDLAQYRDTVGQAVGAVQKMRQLTQGAMSGQMAQGWAADGVNFMNNVVGTMRQLVPNGELGDDAKQALASYQGKGGTFDNWMQKTGVSESLWSDLTMQLASTYAHGQRISNVDISRAARTLGEHMSDPASIASVLKDVEGRTVEDIHRQKDLLKLTPSNDTFKSSVDDLSKYFDTQLGVADSEGWTTLPNGVRIRPKG